MCIFIWLLGVSQIDRLLNHNIQMDMFYPSYLIYICIYIYIYTCIRQRELLAEFSRIGWIQIVKKCWENHAFPIRDPDQLELTDLVNPVSRHLTHILSSMTQMILIQSQWMARIPYVTHIFYHWWHRWYWYNTISTMNIVMHKLFSCSIPGSLYTARGSSLAVNDRTWAFE